MNNAMPLAESMVGRNVRLMFTALDAMGTERRARWADAKGVVTFARHDGAVVVEWDNGVEKCHQVAELTGA